MERPPCAPVRPADLPDDLLECVVNVSEGRDGSIIARLAASCGPTLADVHTDPGHNRSVFTLLGRTAPVEKGARGLAVAVVGALDLRLHSGAHPRIGALDVVPFVALEGWPLRNGSPGRARAARGAFAGWAAAELGLPVYLYGPERSLPEVRRGAWQGLPPDAGPQRGHPTAGAVAVGCRRLLVAYNLWLADADLGLARRLAAGLRSPAVRALGLQLGSSVQVSCNLLEPLEVGPAEVWDAVSAAAPVARAELVGLVPWAVLARAPAERWHELDLAPERSLEHALWSRQ